MAKLEEKRQRKHAKRQRRRPEDARELILDAAEAVFAERGPDAAGLKDVAQRAGVSRALVNHYFGSYEELVEATMERVVGRGRNLIVTRLAAMATPTPEDLLEVFFTLMDQPQLGRLFAWAAITGRLGEDDFFARREQGPRQVADVLEQRIRAELPDPSRFDRDELDYHIMLVLSAGLGLAAGRGALFHALGRPNDAAQKAAFRRWLGELLRDRLAACFGIEPPPRTSA
ncbi:MAG: helix-turn-helix domain-containing protein [Polyangiaceae bacterium]